MSDQRPKVVRIIARLNIGGPAIHVILLSEGLKEYETVLVKGMEADSEGDMMDLAHERGVKPVIVDRLGRDLNVVRDLSTLWHLYRLLRKERPDIVHTHTAKAGTLGRIAARLAGVPVVIHTFHGHVLSGYFSPMKTRFFTLIERWLARWSDVIINVSEKCREDLLSVGIGNDKKMITIPLGLELDRFQQQVPALAGRFRERLGIPEDVPVVSHVARMVPIKRHDVFLRAIRRVWDQFPEARFVLVGDGEMRPQLERLAEELDLDDRLVWAGFVREQELIYADTDLLVLTSDNEGLPVAVIEALASGRPVISTRVGGVPELIDEGETGYIVPPGNPEALADALVDALSDMDRLRRMGQKGQQKTLEKYNSHRLVHDIDRLYQSLLKKRAG